MSFRNFLDLRKKTQQQTRIIEHVVFQSRSLKSDLFLALSVMLVASFVIWGISKADDSATSVPSVIPAEAGIQSQDSEFIDTNTNLDPRIREDDNARADNNAGADDNSGASSTNYSLPTTNSSTTSTPTILENIIDVVTNVGDQIKDSITNVIDKVTDVVTDITTPANLDEEDLKGQAGTSTPETATTTPETTDTSTTTPIVQITEQDTDTGKLVTISSPNESTTTPLVDVLAYTTIPRIYKVGEENKIQIKWKNEGNLPMQFNAFDTDLDGYLDYVEWTVPHLSTQTFEIIFISKAFQLDQDKNIISDIYDTVKTQDGNYASITHGQYIRTTFEQVLDEQKDITLYARPTTGTANSIIEVYPVYTNANGNKVEGPLIAVFENIDHEGLYKILLTNIGIPTDTFDLKAVGDVDVDYVVDPIFSCQSNATGAWSAVGTWTNCNGTIPQVTDKVQIMTGHTVTLTADQSVGSITVGTGGILDLSIYNLNTGTVNLTGGTISGSSGILTGTSYAVQSGTISAILGGAGVALTKTTSGTVILSGNNTYTGLTTASAGTLKLSGDNSLMSGGVTLSSGTWLLINSATALGTGTFTINGGTINNTSSGNIVLTTNNAQVWNSSFTFYGDNALDLGTGPITLGGNIWVYSQSQALTVRGNIGDGGNAYSIVFSKGGGIGGFYLYGNNTYTGLTTISGTVVKFYGDNIAMSGGVTATGGTAIIGIGSNTALGTGTLTINGGSIDAYLGSRTLTTNNAQVWNSGFTFYAANALNLGTGPVTLGGDVNINAINSSVNILTVGGIINDGGHGYNLSKSGIGTLVLSGANTYNGLTTVSAGMLTLSGDNSVASGGVTLTAGTLNINSATALGTGTFTINGGTIANTSAGALTLSTNNVQAWNGNFIFASVRDLNLGTGAVTLGANRTVSVNYGGSTNLLTVGGAIGDGGNGYTLTKAGIYYLTLTGNNTYDGLTTVSAGSLTLSGDNAAASGGVTLTAGTLNINSATALGTGTFTINGGGIGNTSAGALTLSTNNAQAWNSDFTYGGTKDLNLGTGAVTLGGNRTVSINNGGFVLTVGGVIGDGGNGYTLTCSSPSNGSLILSGANTFTGGTTISAGILQLNNALALQNSTVIVSVASGLKFGPSIGTFTIGGLAGVRSFALTNTDSVAVTLQAGQNNSNTTYSGVMSGTGGAFIKQGSGTLIFSSANTYTGATTVAGGILQQGIANSFKSATTSISSGAVLDLSTYSLTLAGSTAFNNNGTLKLAGGQTVTNIVTNGSNSTVEYNGTAGPYTLKNYAYNNLTINGPGATFNLPASLTVANNLTITAGTLDTTASNYALSVGGNWVNNGTFIPRLGTVTLTGTSTGAAITSGGSPFYNLIQNGSGGTYTLQDALTTTNNLTNTAGTLDTKSGSSHSVTVGGNWTNTGTFTPQQGTVTLSGVLQTISGSNTFYNLIKQVVSTDTLTFVASTTQTITHALTLSGTPNQLLSLVSSIPGTLWNLVTTGATSLLSYLGVTDSNSAISVSATNSVNNGNNTNWAFPFVSTWDTTATSTGSSNNNQIKLPLYNGGTYNFVVDWGDNSSSTITTWNQAQTTHTYASTGTYTISISGTLTGWSFANTGDKLKIKNISQWGILNLGNVATGYFYGTANLKITATDILNTTGTINMGSAFRASGIDTVPSMNSWDVSKVTNMTAMFYGTNFNQNIGSWVTSSTIDMSSMFNGATSFNNGGSNTINDWDTANVISMNKMFQNASVFNQNIGSWNVAKVTNMSGMFWLASAFNQNIGSWNVAKVTDMSRMFQQDGAFNQNIGGWNTANVTDMNMMFYNDSAFNQNIGSWNTAKVTNMSNMFNACSNFNQNIGSWVTASTTNMASMFYGSSAFNNGGSNTINNWNTANVTTMANMFQSATSFNQDIGSWDTTNTTNMAAMFYGTTAFNNGGSNTINNWNTSNVTNMGWMFRQATAFNQNIGSWNTSKVTDMSYMFQNDTAFNQNIGSWVTASTTSMTAMFQGASAFNQDLGNWNVTNVTGMIYMFQFASVLSAVNYSNILVGWSAQAVKTGITLSTGPKYYTGIPAAARGVLTGTYGWTITDGGSQAPATFNDSVNGNWSAGTTWGNVSNVEGVGYPGPYDTAIINSNTVTLTGTQSSATTTLSGTGILNLAGSNFTSPSFTVSSLLQLQGGETVSTPTLNASSTVEYTATTSTRDIKNWNYTNSLLKINGSGGTFTLPTNIIVSGINILAGILDTKSGSNFSITNSGNWSNSAGVSGFSAGSGTVTFSGLNSTITGATNFYRTNGSGTILAFPSLSTILENNTLITTNNGIVGINNSTITTNSNTGVVNTNNSTITTNDGLISSNSLGGSITYNNGTVDVNSGEVYDNGGTINSNYNLVDRGFGTVLYNDLEATIARIENGGILVENDGTVNLIEFGGTVTHNLGSIIVNNGTTDTNIFTDGGYNGATGHITGDAIFNYSGFVATDGSIIDFTGYANGIVDGLTKDSLGNTILTWVFNDTDNLGHVTGDAMFNGTTTNTGTVDGSVIFNNSSRNEGTIMHNVDIFSPVPRPLGGIVYGLKTYHGYDGMYFNDTAVGHGVTGKWNDALNWWTDSAFTNHAGDFAGAGDEVHIYSDISTTTISASAASITFESGAKNHININISGDATFFGTSTNDTDGGITASSTTFIGNLTDNLGTVAGTLIRKFTGAVATTRDFTAEGGRDNWIIIAQGVIVDISNAIYNTTTNIFKALNGGIFTTGSNPSVTPTIISTLPTGNEIILKWLPSITWDNANLCEYSYDNWTTTIIADCAENGADIARPEAGSQILSLRGTDTRGNITEENIPFTYDNISPVWTTCGEDYLDETTREYYYLKDADVTGNCHLKVSAELRGAETGTGVLTGNVVSDATSTNAFSIILRNITVSGTTTAMTSAEGKDGGNIIVENSTVGALVSDGALGTVGGKAGNITVATSSTGIITANGGSGTSQGSNGGIITVWNSDGLLASTLVEAIGGSATVCGNGGEGGDIEILNSNNYVALSDSGADQIEAGTGKCAVPGTPGSHVKKTPIVVARPVPPSASINTNTNQGGSSVRKAFVQNTINQITLPVQKLNPIKLTKLPTFGTDTKGSFSLLAPLKAFLFNTSNISTTISLKKYPELQKYITDTLHYNSDQKLVALYNKPLKLDAKAPEVLGIFKVISPPSKLSDYGNLGRQASNALVTTLNVDKKGNLSQHIDVNLNDNYQTLNISLAITSKVIIEGKLTPAVIPAEAGIQSAKSEKYSFTNNKTNISTTLNIPQKAGIYTFTTSASPLPLVIEVTSAPNTTVGNTSTTQSWWGKVKAFFSL